MEISQKVKMKKRKFRIGELAKKLKVKKFVVRFWEKEFELKSNRSGGGQRFYTQEDLDTFCNIKNLLYDKKFTISGAKKELETLTSKKINPAIKQDFSCSSNIKSDTKIPEDVWNKIKTFKQNLKKFAKLF